MATIYVHVHVLVNKQKKCCYSMFNMDVITLLQRGITITKIHYRTNKQCYSKVCKCLCSFSYKVTLSEPYGLEFLLAMISQLCWQDLYM